MKLDQLMTLLLKPLYNIEPFDKLQRDVGAQNIIDTKSIKRMTGRKENKKHVEP